jgi:hypothetical protein
VAQHGKGLPGSLTARVPWIGRAQPEHHRVRLLSRAIMLSMSQHGRHGEDDTYNLIWSRGRGQNND